MLEIGGGRLIEGFEEQLVGARAGETRTVQVDFPDEYPAEELKGRDAEFDVQVKDVKEKQLPELDDDFASEASEFDTLDELRADIQHKLEHAQEHSIEDEFRQAAVDAAVAEADIDLPDDLVTARAEEMWERTERVLRAQGVDPETYLTGVRQARARRWSRRPRRTRAARSPARACWRRSPRRRASRCPTTSCSRRSGGRPSARGTKPEKLLERLKESGRDVPIRRELRLRKAVDAIADSAQPIEPGTAKAREAIWTPDKQREEEGSAQLWTPGSGEPPADAAPTAARVARAGSTPRHSPRNQSPSRAPNPPLLESPRGGGIRT